MVIRSLKLIFSILFCLSAGWLGSISTSSSAGTWYQTLNKPVFTPPNWLFAPVWTLLYTFMGIALFLILEKDFKKKNVKIALFLFGVQLILNVLWTFIFFGWQMPGLALAEIIVLGVVLIACVIVFKKVSQAAAWLFVPYVLWVTYAVFLNAGIVVGN